MPPQKGNPERSAGDSPEAKKLLQKDPLRRKLPESSSRTVVGGIVTYRGRRLRSVKSSRPDVSTSHSSDPSRSLEDRGGLRKRLRRVLRARRFLREDRSPSWKRLLATYRQAVLDSFIDSIVDEEGFIHWPYLDNKGLVTFGIGVLGDGAAKARFMSQPWTIDGKGADLATVDHWWGVVKARQDKKGIGGGNGFWASLTPLRLDDDAIREATKSWIADNEPTLVKEFPGYSTWPADAQMGALGMAYALGSAFGDSYHLFKAAVNATVPNFTEAANQSSINKNVDSAIAAHNATNRQLFLNAANAQHSMTPYDRLWWPANVDPGSAPVSYAFNYGAYQAKTFFSPVRLAFAILAASAAVLGVSMALSARRGEGWTAPIRKLESGAERFEHAIETQVRKAMSAARGKA